MEDKYDLVKKYNINIDVYIDEDGVKPIKKLPDNKLTKEFLKLYFLNKIEKVWKDWMRDYYYARTKDGERIYLEFENITADDIEAIIADKRGGRRKGAGRKKKTGMSTVTMRIPDFLKDNIQCLIDMYAHWLDKEHNYFTSEKKRFETIRDIGYVLDFEKKCIYNRQKTVNENKE